MGARLSLPPPRPWTCGTPVQWGLPKWHWPWCGFGTLSAGALGPDSSRTDPQQQQGTAAQCLLFVTSKQKKNTDKKH